MNTLEEIPKDQLDHFKKNVKDWLELDNQIKELEKKTRELKKLKNKQLEPKITGFMRSYNISDLNTESGKLRCNERNTKTPINKKTIQESLIGTRPIGTFLSGGLDSAMIAIHAKKYTNQKTFTNHIQPCPADPNDNPLFQIPPDPAENVFQLLVSVGRFPVVEVFAT